MSYNLKSNTLSRWNRSLLIFISESVHFFLFSDGIATNLAGYNITRLLSQSFCDSAIWAWLIGSSARQQSRWWPGLGSHLGKDLLPHSHGCWHLVPWGLLDRAPWFFADCQPETSLSCFHVASIGQLTA